MVGSGMNDNAPSAGRSDTGGSSTTTHHPVDDPQQQQHHNTAPENNVDPRRQQSEQPTGYPASEPAGSQGPYQHQTRSANPNASTWQQTEGGAPPHHQGYPPNPPSGPSYSQYPQRPQPGPTGPAPGSYYPHQQQAPQRPGPQFVPPVRPPPMSPRNPFAPALIRPDLGPPVPWTSDIFGFLQDCHGCFLTVLAPCITFGQIAEIVDTGYNTCATAGIIYAVAFLLGIPCLYSYTYRTKMRRHFNLRPDPLDDLCVHFWCELCALSQEYRELSYRGIDPSLGYVMQQDAIAQAMDNPVAPGTAAPVQMNMMK